MPITVEIDSIHRDKAVHAFASQIKRLLARGKPIFNDSTQMQFSLVGREAFNAVKLSGVSRQEALELARALMAESASKNQS